MRAVIFDCDGVLVDSEALSCGALNTVFERYFDIDIGTDYTPIIGKALQDSLGYYLEKYGVKNYDLATLIEAKEKAYRDSARGNLQSFPGAKEVLKEIKDRGIALAVASSGSLPKIRFSLTEVGFLDKFSVIASAEEVERGKPHPDVFLLAAERLGVLPEECVVIEDSVNGGRGAISAGMRVLGFPGAFGKSDFEKIGAGFLVDGYHSLMTLLRDNEL